jgi:subtilisin family serine protease
MSSPQSDIIRLLSFTFLAHRSPEGNTFISRAKGFLTGMQASIDDVDEIARSCRGPSCLRKPVKIAILDTGVDLSDPSIEEYVRRKRIVDYKGFAGDAADVQDKNGHGTHVAKILIKNAPVADFYIAKVSNNTKVPATQLPQVAEVRIAF